MAQSSLSQFVESAVEKIASHPKTSLQQRRPSLWDVNAAPQSSVFDHSTCQWASWKRLSQEAQQGKEFQDPLSRSRSLGLIGMQKSSSSKSKPPGLQKSTSSKSPKLSQPTPKGERRAEAINLDTSKWKVVDKRVRPTLRLKSAPSHRRSTGLAASGEDKAETLKAALYASWAKSRELEEQEERKKKLRQTLEGMLGSIVSERLQGSEAEEWLKQNLKENPQDLDNNLRSSFHSELAKLILRHGGDPTIVRTELLTALSYDPENLCAKIALCQLFEGPLEMKSTAKTYYADLEKDLLAAHPDSKVHKYILVDVAQFHERCGNHEEARQLYAKAAAEPWVTRDTRLQNVPRDWNFTSELSVPTDGSRIQASTSLADKDLAFHRPLKPYCNCRCPPKGPKRQDLRKSLMVAETLQTTASTNTAQMNDIQKLGMQIRQNTRSLRRKTLAQAEALGKATLAGLPGATLDDSDSQDSEEEDASTNPEALRRFRKFSDVHGAMGHTVSTSPTLALKPHLLREVCQMGLCTSLYGLARDAWTTAESTRNWVHQAEDVARKFCAGRRFHVNVVDAEESGTLSDEHEH